MLCSAECARTWRRICRAFRGSFRDGRWKLAPSVSTGLLNARVKGLRNAFNALIGLLQLILRVGPSLLLFGALLGLPAYFLWKKLRHR